MSFSALTIAVIVAYASGCLVYVYRWRGTTRYATLKQYLRKSWPIFAPLNCLLYMATPGSARRPVRSAMRLCPKTMALLAQVPEVRGAMFSILPPGAELSLHADPLACSLRYHLGLSTPNCDECHIVVDGTRCSWRNGQDFVFDETYPHYAQNNTDTSRLSGDGCTGSASSPSTSRCSLY
jgi:hypothetical protein